MRTTYAVAGLVASVAAKAYTVTETKDVTVTSCGPEYTDCPAWSDWQIATTTKPVDPVKPTTWSEWQITSTKPVDPVKPTTWSEWASTSKKPVDPVKPSTWSEWAATSTKPVEPVKPTTWSEWQGTTTKKPVEPVTTTWADWDTTSYACPSYTASGPPSWFSQLPDDARKSVEAKWSGAPPKDWCYYTYSQVKTSSTPVAPVSPATSTWGGWSATSAGPVAKYTGAATLNNVQMGFAGLAGLAAVMLA